jgi:hypothetical protein
MASKYTFFFESGNVSTVIEDDAANSDFKAMLDDYLDCHEHWINLPGLPIVRVNLRRVKAITTEEVEANLPDQAPESDT